MGDQTQTQASTQMYDCIVVGAGYSGLAASKLLAFSGHQILLFEARERVGGRAKTIPVSDGASWDVGGSFLGVGQHLMYGLAREYSVSTFAIPTEGKLVLRHRGRSRTYSGLIPPMRPWEVLDAGLVLRRFERMCEAADVEAPWRTPGAEELDRVTVREWFRAHTWTSGARDTVDMAMEAVLGQAPQCVSMLHALFYFKAAGSLTAAISVAEGLQRDLMAGGGMAIAEKMKVSLGDEVVRLGEAVQSVRYDDEGCEVTTTKGATYRAKKAIFAIPPPLLLKVQFDPPLPAQKTALLQHMPMGAFSKVFATYKTPFWRDRGLRGECTNPRGFVSVTFDATPPEPGAPGKMMGFLVGTMAREFAKLSSEEQRRVSLDELASMLGEEALEPLEFFYHSMMDEEWATGCPMATPAPGMWTMYGEWMRKPVGPIHWAGTEASTRFYGYMEGAVDSGQRAAKEVIEKLD